jgi:hypothetical protein
VNDNYVTDASIRTWIPPSVLPNEGQSNLLGDDCSFMLILLFIAGFIIGCANIWCGSRGCTNVIARIKLQIQKSAI